MVTKTKCIRPTMLERMRLIFWVLPQRKALNLTVRSRMKYAANQSARAFRANKRRSTYQYSGMAQRLLGETNAFLYNFLFVLQFPKDTWIQKKKTTTQRRFPRKPQSHVRIFIY